MFQLGRVVSFLNVFFDNNWAELFVFLITTGRSCLFLLFAFLILLIRNCLKR